MNRIEGGTVIGRSTKMRGELSGTEDFVLEGEFEGAIRLTGSKLTVGVGAHARASLGAQDIVVFGRVDGEIRASGSVSLRDGSVVVGDIFAARFSIEENAIFRGRVDPTRAGEPFPVKPVQQSAMSTPLSGLAPEDLRLVPPVAPLSAPRGLNPALNLFGSDRREPVAPPPPMPAGLAAAARHFEAANSSISSAETSGSVATANDSTELAETKA
jgi:cytoskeletal protein CcmA (bactofilin family)